MGLKHSSVLHLGGIVLFPMGKRGPFFRYSLQATGSCQ